MRRRISTFESFEYKNENNNSDRIRIYDYDQYDEFIDYLTLLSVELDATFSLDLLIKENWDELCRENHKIAVIKTEEDYKGEKAIIALLNDDGEVLESWYNDGSNCDTDFTEYFLNKLELNIRQNESTIKTNIVNEADEYNMSLSPDLIKAINKQDVDEISALISDGADLSFNDWEPLKIAAEIGDLDILEILYSEIDDGELTEEEGQKLIDYCINNRLGRNIENYVRNKVNVLTLDEN
jgi:hypothetical protein